MLKLTPVTLPPGWAKLATRSMVTRLSPMLKTIGVVVVAALARQWRPRASGRDDEADPSTNQFGRHRRHSFCPIVGPAVFDRQVFPPST
jgi:hypothetical protein